jgi:NAD(P)-dependent dehydrogenase (short-subunit alcohol dehydrogenase family)
MDLQGKLAIVTGGGTGMGKEIAKLLAAAGTHVVVNYSRSEAEALRRDGFGQEFECQVAVTSDGR